MNRRGFLKSFGALAALAVAGPALAQLEPIANASLIEAMRSGLVENQTFLMDGPFVIDIPYLTIRNCTFLFNAKLNETFVRDVFGPKAHHCTIESCSFQTMKG